MPPLETVCLMVAFCWYNFAGSILLTEFSCSALPLAYQFLFYLNNPKSVASILSVMRLKASVSDSNFCVSPSTMISLPL